MTKRAALLLSVLTAACGVSPTPDAGPLADASLDAGQTDGGPDTDGGALDADTPVDAGPLEPVVCDSAPADIYDTPPGPDGTPAGTLLRCATQTAIPREAMDTAIEADGVNVTSGATRFLIAYQTERQPGVVGVGSAVVLVPDAPVAEAPLMVVSHGTAGLADTCAPSSRDELDADLVLPWAASGMPTVAMDYAGLGTAGIQGYGDAYDTSQSVLDGARAALQLLDDDRAVVMVGHSQGGGATLSAQGLAPTYAPELRVERSIAIAGGSSGGLELTPAQAPFLGLFSLRGGAGAIRAFFTMIVYADLANRLGEDRALEGFDASLRDTIDESMDRDCIFAMAAFLNTPSPGYTPPNTLGQLLDADFLQSVRDCISDRPACTPEGRAFLEQRTERDFIPVSPDGGDVLVIAGSADTLHTPEQHACTLAAIDATGTTREGCYLDGATHFNVVEQGIATAIAYALDGTVSCPDNATTPPACE